ncbi:MAG: DUF4286 family protein [Cytophagales bacterium]|nr:MAG: DUF4286 family protein [Cytophagales bacterium]
MVIYNVTVSVDADIEQEWSAWMRSTHIGEVMATGLFVKYQLLKMVEDPENTAGVTYAVQYYLNNLEDFLNYSQNYAPALQAKTREKYGDKALAFRTLLEVIEAG